jgi:hypothetical protein
MATVRYGRVAASLVLLSCLASASTVPPTTNEASPLRVIRTYDAWRQHDPRNSRKTQMALSAAETDCGPVAGLFELLRPNTSHKVAAAIVSRIDEGDLPRVIEDAFAHVSALLPGPAITICVYAAELSRGLPYLGGVGGISMGGGRIHIFLHPTKERFAKVPYTVAHEYYHEIERSLMPPRTPDDILVSEGKADHFAFKLYPQLRPPHTTPLTNSELVTTWSAFHAYRRTDRATFRTEFMIAPPAGKLPLWAGYKLAFEMVGHYVEATGSGPSEWLHMQPQNIIDSFATSPRLR